MKKKHPDFDEHVLNQIRKMDERKIHTSIVIPMLKNMGCLHIEYLHGAFEKGKDLVYSFRDHFGDSYIEVCQIKNQPFSGKANSDNNTIAVLSQLKQCKNIEVFNPIAKKNELPQSIILLTTYPIPTKDTVGASKLLEELHTERCKIVSPQQFVNLIKVHLPDVYNSLAYPGQDINHKLCSYACVHKEYEALGLLTKRKIENVYVNVGFKPRFVFKDINCDSSNASDIFEEDLKTKIIRESYHELLIIEEVIACNSKTTSLLSLQQPEQLRNVGEKKLILKDFNPLQKFREILQRSRNEEEYLQSIRCIEYYIKCLLPKYGRDMRPKSLSLTRFVEDLDVPEITPEKILSINNNVCIIGNAGVGKTTFSKMLLKNAVDKGIKCIYIPCSFIQEKNDVIEIVTNYIRSIINDIPNDAIRKYIQLAELIIIDGCDESPGFLSWLSEIINKFIYPTKLVEKIRSKGFIKVNIPNDLYGKVTYDPDVLEITIETPLDHFDYLRLIEMNDATVAKSFQSIHEKHKSFPKFILTTRTEKPLNLPNNMFYMNLAGFSDMQLKTFFNKRFYNDTKAVEEIMKFLSENEYIKEMTRLPMNATVIAALYENKYDLPSSKTDLYTKRFDLLLEKWQKAKGINLCKIKSSDKLFLLSRLALQLHIKHERNFNKEQVIDIWNTGISRNYPDVTPEEVITELEIYNGVIFSEGTGSYNLGHLSYQEYLTAHSMLRQKQKYLVDNYFDPWWQNVIIFYSGLCGDVSEFLTQVQNKHMLINKGGLIEEILKEARLTAPVTFDFIEELVLDPFDD